MVKIYSIDVFYNAKVAGVSNFFYLAKIHTCIPIIYYYGDTVNKHHTCQPIKT